jgi:hypothetical protein
MTQHERRIYEGVEKEFVKLFELVDRKQAHSHGPEVATASDSENEKFILNQELFLHCMRKK